MALGGAPTFAAGKTFSCLNCPFRSFSFFSSYSFFSGISFYVTPFMMFLMCRLDVFFYILIYLRYQKVHKYFKRAPHFPMVWAELAGERVG